MLKKILKKTIIAILTLEAKLILRKYHPKIIAVTGSVGKTSTKDAIYSGLKGKFSVRKSQKSYNSEIGLPLTVIGASSGWNQAGRWIEAIFQGIEAVFKKTAYPEVLVLEMGADRPGDIEKFSRWLKPSVAVMTAVGEMPVHVEFFSGPEAVAKEKEKILLWLDSDDFAVLNRDDTSVFEMREKTKARVLTFGLGEEADVLASNYHIIYKEEADKPSVPEGITFKVDFKGSSVPVRLLNTFGRHHIYSALAALAVGSALELNLVEISEGLSGYSAPPGRLKLIKGIKNAFILDDTYNASPASVHAALDTLKDIRAKRKIAVLGDMLELGRFAIEAHREIGLKTAGVSDLIFAVGPRAKFIAAAAREARMSPEKIFELSDSREAGKKLQNEIQEGDLILVKGSQSMRMERAVEEIMANPQEKEKLLVRQEKEWMKKT